MDRRRMGRQAFEVFMSARNRYLMGPPDFFTVSYVINPWMEGNIRRTAPDRAQAQWQRLHTLIQGYADVELVAAQPGLPDLPFVANAGLILEDKVILSRFMHPERQGEEPHFEDWFSAHNYTVYKLPPQIPFEGAGDALLDRGNPWLWAGYGHRSALDSHGLLAKWLELEVLSLRLVDDRFYHLDTCFCPLQDGYLLYYPPAFDELSCRLIQQRVPADKLFAVSEKDAVNFACNAVNIDKVVLLNRATPQYVDRLQEWGFQVIQTELTEFMKAGGAAKCLTLKLNEPRLVAAAPSIQMAQRQIQLEGHLLDANLMSRVMDTITSDGGSFEILEFIAGPRPQDTSRAQMLVTAPSQDRLEQILTALIDVGARLPATETRDAELFPVLQKGVAPEDFYITTIYRTEVRVKDQWYPVQGQRMDGAIVVTETPEIQVQCCLLRDLDLDQQVVCAGPAHRPSLARPPP